MTLDCAARFLVSIGSFAIACMDDSISKSSHSTSKHRDTLSRRIAIASCINGGKTVDALVREYETRDFAPIVPLNNEELSRRTFVGHHMFPNYLRPEYQRHEYMALLQIAKLVRTILSSTTHKGRILPGILFASDFMSTSMSLYVCEIVIGIS
jgi:hypothetical protein